jgi:UDP-N-acetylmuramate--alanine ligase
VAGTHGKTTTTAMLALIAREAGLEPTFIVGGYVNQLGSNAAAGSGDLFIIEADEYDRTFLGLKPDIAVVTVLEWDHPDCYPTYQSMVTAYRQFVSSVPASGLVIGCGDEPGVRDLLAFVLSQPPPAAGVVTYGVQAGNDWRAVDTQSNSRGGYDFKLLRPGETIQANEASSNAEPLMNISLVVPGIHNVKNALAALVAADSLGVPVDRAAFALSLFDGVERRFQIKGTAGGVLVVDDYAHHPTEIRATLSAARARYPGRPIWVVFQPHTYSRTLALLDDFTNVFAQADHVILVDIYAAREVNDGAISSADVANYISHPDVRYIGSHEKAAAYLIAHLEPDAVLITLGAGDGYQVGEMVLRDGSD